VTGREPDDVAAELLALWLGAGAPAG